MAMKDRVPRETLKVRASGRSKREIAKEAKGSAVGVARAEVEIEKPLEMLKALALDAGLLEDGEEIGGICEKVLKGAIDWDKRAGDAPTGRKCLAFLVDYGCGMRYMDALGKNGLDKADVAIMRRRNKAYREMYGAAEAARMASAMPEVLDSVIDMAVEGEVDPVFNGEGVQIGERRHRSVKAAELLLKAGDKRFSGRGSGVAGGGVQINVAWMPTVQLPPPGSRPAPAIDIEGEVEGAAEAAALPAPAGESGAVDMEASIAAKVAALPDDLD